MIDLEYPNLLKLFPEHLAPKLRSESASFLILYLENYYRLDAIEAVDSVCDQRGDKGVDGIFVNDDDRTITVLQSRIAQKSGTLIGDKPLREFAGTLSQFESAESIQNLIASGGAAAVSALAKRLDLVNKIDSHELRGEFVTNAEIDANGLAFLKEAPINFIGGKLLVDSYVSDERTPPIQTPVSFDLVGLPYAEYVADADTTALIATVKATELVTLDGIADQSLFIYNVRGSLGRTKVNKDIAKTISEKAQHKYFPLFHNGITILAGDVDEDTSGSITVSDYYVVNGCQSLTALYDNRANLTDDLRVVCKIIRMDPQSALASRITEISNTQNGMKARDFKANDKIQIRLQNEFSANYNGQYSFEIKRGEVVAGTPISNEDAGLFLMAFDLKEPWATHRKYMVFDDKHSEIFGRPEVTADRIVLCQVIMEVIKELLPTIRNDLVAKYVLTQYMLLYMVRQVLENDKIAEEILRSPKGFVRSSADREIFRKCIRSIVSDLVDDLNHEVAEVAEDFDYRGKLRDEKWVKDLAKTMVGTHTKLVNRGKIKSFREEWLELSSGVGA